MPTYSGPLGPSASSAPSGRDDIPVFDSDALDALGGLFDTLARGLDLADRLERVDGGGETAAYLRTLTLGFIQAVRTSSSALASGAPAPGDAPAPGAPASTPGPVPPYGPGVPDPTGLRIRGPVEGEVAYVYAASQVFGTGDALSNPGSSGFVCWVEDYIDPNNSDYRHLGWWAPPDAPPPGARPAINARTGSQWTAWEYVREACGLDLNIDEDFVYGPTGWLPPEVFI